MTRNKQQRRTYQKRTYAQIFLDKLTDLSDDGSNFVSNRAMRDALTWDSERYERVKERLVIENLIEIGKGQGGSVRLTFTPNSQALTLFVSYSHADEALKNALIKHLEPLKRMMLIETWHDGMLKAGDEWEQEITESLEVADIILLLVSIDFINSEYCYDRELEQALERHADGEAVVIPIILRPCMWQHTPFAKLQALPKGAKAVALWENQDEAMADIAKEIQLVAERKRDEQ